MSGVAEVVGAVGEGLQMVASLMVRTDRLETHVLMAGSNDGVPVVFVHGNVSSGRFWEETIAGLPPRYRGLALDLRGFGLSEGKPIDARRGLRDFSDDVHGLMVALGLDGGSGLHLVGWSVGGGVVMQYALDHPGQVASLTLVAPMSPFGFGGTRGVDGALVWPDGAGSGGGTANPEFVQRLAAGDRGVESPFSPRMVMNSYYFRPPFQVASDREEVFVSALLQTRVGDGFYPGDLSASAHWPGVAPGVQGMNNAIAPQFCDVSGFAALMPQPAVLWVRGSDDQIVSDTSLFDFGFLGQIGAVPGWPGDEVFPPQPMVSQMRAVLDGFRARGGVYREEVFAECGHSPHIEYPARFREVLVGFLDGLCS